MLLYFKASPSVIDSTCLRSIKQVVNRDFLIKAPTDQILMKNHENIGKIKKGLHIHKYESDEKKELRMEEDKLTSENQKIVAQIPVAKRSIAAIMSNLLKPL